jgi:outer membrane protein assembly factor BamD
MFKSFLRQLILGIALTFLSACAIIDYVYLPPPEDTAQELYEAGMDSMRDKKFYDAIGYFNKLKDRFPFSPYTPQAEIALGDAFFLDGQYAQAADTYKEFESLHPRHEQIAYVLLQIGLADMKRSESVDLPMDHLQEALQFFTLVKENFPGTEYHEAALANITACRTRMAEHEIFIADFYFNTEQFGAAWKRYMYTAENYSELPKIVEYSKVRAEVSYLAYQKTLSEEERRAIEGSWKRWLKKYL